jgi:hypothetical protein
MDSDIIDTPRTLAVFLRDVVLISGKPSRVTIQGYRVGPANHNWLNCASLMHTVINVTLFELLYYAILIQYFHLDAIIIIIFV